MKVKSSATSPVRPAQLVEHHVITGILDGTYPPGRLLPNERQLAEIIGVARPPLRETLHRLANEGWLTIAHGKPTQVNDYWEKGSMGVLSTLVKYIDTLPAGFVIHLMEVRSRLLPIIAGLAVAQAPDEVHTYLEAAGQIDDDVSAFVDFDWRLHLFLATQSRNPIYKLILNDLSTMFKTLAAAYFSIPAARAASRQYYRDLSTAVQAGSRRVETVVMDAMMQSISLWESIRVIRS
ncbi:fatty acid metabolism transcriptional regulator FadR [Desulfosarcina sp.]|uniref:fatty acid metabolism transcriptional regulator FadR n=1 Tax=Desulfosarcina sp. TaxID=2027861 RepID=UPI0029B80B0D|nr:fatty acid metabolism transcriptional regulator FadR [Desulfosarcina sp.]MDX2451865.1 fatty acid metabolism transcriptional regulator FadR [Desulfosarcina sp.]MDX2489655.1 fatty acid metabolism transcriptional regulator FadR [Desulfosarcina sp.]